MSEPVWRHRPSRTTAPFEGTTVGVPKTTTGLTVATAGLAVLTGPAAAHFPPGLDIDVKPGTEENPIDPRGRSVRTVAVLHSDVFDPTSEDVRYFGSPGVVTNGDGARPVGHRVHDVDGDGREDLVLPFRTSEAGFDHGDEEAELRWDRDDTREHGLSGGDQIRTVGGDRR